MERKDTLTSCHTEGVPITTEIEGFPQPLEDDVTNGHWRMTSLPRIEGSRGHWRMPIIFRYGM